MIDISEEDLKVLLNIIDTQYNDQSLYNSSVTDILIRIATGFREQDLRIQKLEMLVDPEDKYHIHPNSVGVKSDPYTDASPKHKKRWEV